MAQIDYYKELAALCRQDYYFFVKTFWREISTEKLIPNWHLPYLCGEIQQALERVFAGEPKLHDIICNVSPGTSKSSIFSVLLLPWAWTRMPGLRMIGVSFDDSLAFELTLKSRRVVQSPLYQTLFPEIQLRAEQNNKSLWSNTLGGDRYAAGTGSGITGKHAHVIVIDDPINPKQGRSKVATDEAAAYVTETLPSRKVSKAVTVTMLVMQRISINDPTQVFLDKFPDVKHICLPGEESNLINPPELRKHYKDGLFDPIRLTRKDLTNAAAELGEYGYAGQFLQMPIPPGGGAIKVDRIVTDHLAPPADKVFKKIVRFWDKAALAESGDYTVGVKMGIMDDGNVWILDICRGQWDTDAREKMIRAKAMMDTKSVRIGFEQEPGSAGIDSAKEAVKRLHGFIAVPIRATGNKLDRAELYSTQVNGGNVHTAMKGKVWDDYVAELQHFPDGANDDQVDASSGAYSMLIQNTVKLGVIK